MPAGSQHRLERTLGVALAVIAFILVAAIIAGTSLLSQLSAEASRNHASAVSACLSTNASRRDGNAHVRVPLKAVADELALILREAAAGQKDKAKKTQVLQLAELFARYSSEVHSLPLLNCTKVNE